MGCSPTGHPSVTTWASLRLYRCRARARVASAEWLRGHTASRLDAGARDASSDRTTRCGGGPPTPRRSVRRARWTGVATQWPGKNIRIWLCVTSRHILYKIHQIHCESHSLTSASRYQPTQTEPHLVSVSQRPRCDVRWREAQRAGGPLTGATRGSMGAEELRPRICAMGVIRARVLEAAGMHGEERGPQGRPVVQRRPV
ncbi:hypothetical protein PHLGIDRAFT_424814 [Phlebiopsis gigantea 11061_1 CR5-6]|uniref:Uncharacterized protein n=1 Tax=Phlebiopsis gigantea (strain 11061_1 CR5-6) TaxID=745531 RepID=A0A0C3NQ24_PHLG1|nr:hypothetical protein PHLGIDRAFT_424814 [Phlebiopsis gigantea 11061_1 CR5-6]